MRSREKDILNKKIIIIIAVIDDVLCLFLPVYPESRYGTEPWKVRQ